MATLGIPNPPIDFRHSMLRVHKMLNGADHNVHGGGADRERLAFEVKGSRTVLNDEAHTSSASEPSSLFELLKSPSIRKSTK